jgi:hypothetical protein
LSVAVVAEYSNLPLQWNHFEVGNRAPELAHSCRGVRVEAFPPIAGD